MLGFKGVFARKPRQFDYKPRYYDPEKEARDQRRRELGIDPLGEADAKEDYVPGKYIKRDMYARRGLGQSGGYRHKSTKIFLRLAIMLAIFILAVWWVMNYFEVSAVDVIKSFLDKN